MLTAIVAVSPDWGIGCGDDLLYKNSFDMGFFCGLTQGRDLIVGRRTAQSLPELRNRGLLVLDRKNLEVFSDKIKCARKDWIDLHTEGCVLIGGAKTYKLFASYVDEIYVTHFFKPSEKQADVFFPIEDYPWIKPENGVKIVSNKEFEIILYSRKE